MSNFIETTVPVNINSLSNKLYVTDLATIPGDLQPSISRIIRFPSDSNGHTILIEDVGVVNVDGINLKNSIGQYVLIKNETDVYGKSIGVPEPFIPAGGGTTTATPFPPNVPGIPGGFPPRGPTDAPPAPPVIANYDPITNPTGGVSPYNYYFGHPYRDNDVIDITKSIFGIYKVVELLTPPLVPIETLVLTRTRESLDLNPGSTVFVTGGNTNRGKQFILISNDNHFTLGYSGRKPDQTIDSDVTIILGGTATSNMTTTIIGIATTFTVSTFVGDEITFRDSASGTIIETGTVASITSNTELELNDPTTNNFTNALMYVERTQSVSITPGTTVVNGNFTNFVELLNMGALTPGCIVRIPAIGGEEHEVAVIVNNTTLILSSEHIAGATDVPMFIIGTSDINYDSIIADVPQPLSITDATIDDLNVANLTMDPNDFGGTPVNFEIIAPGTLTIGAGVNVSGIPLSLMNPLWVETYASNVTQTFQITNWVSPAFNSSGSSQSPPGPANYPDGVGLGPLQIFSQDATNTISFMSDATSTDPYFIGGPENNLIDINDLTMIGTIDTPNITSASGTLTISGSIDVNFNGNNITDISTITFDGTNPSITTSAGTLFINSATDTIDFNNNDLVNIDEITSNRLNSDQIAGSTGSTINFLTNNLIGIGNATIGGTLTVTNITSSTNIILDPIGGNVNLNNNNLINIDELSSSSLIVSGTANLQNIVSTGGNNINIIPSPGGTVNFTGQRLNLTNTIFDGYPRIVAMGSFNGDTSTVIGGFRISGITNIATGVWDITISIIPQSPNLANDKHTIQATGSDSTTLTPIIMVARIVNTNTIRVSAYDETGSAIDPDVFFVTVTRFTSGAS
jgi:hypothetical protein